MSFLSQQPLGSLEELGAILHERLTAAEEEREAMRRRPRNSPEEIERKIDELEFNRSTNSMTLQKEKQILREIEALRAQLAEPEAHAAFQAKLDGLRATADDLRQKLDLNRVTVKEIREAIRRHKVISRASDKYPDRVISASDLKTATFTVPKEFVGRAIGKRGATVEKMEQDFCVIIDVDTDSGEVKLVGLADSLGDVQERIEDLTGDSKGRFDLPEGMASVLLSRGASRLQSLESATGCRLSIASDRSHLELEGSDRALNRAKGHLQALYDGCQDIPIGVGVRVALLKDKAALLRELETANNIDIDLQTGAEGGTVARIWGDAAAVTAALEALKPVIEQFSETTRQITITRDFGGWLRANKGAHVRELQKATGVFARIGNSARTDPTTTLDVRGNAESMEKVDAALAELQAQYDATHRVIPVNLAQARAIVGKDGAEVKRLREETGAQIDVDMPSRKAEASGEAEDSPICVRVRGETPEATDAATAVVQAIVANFTEESFVVSDYVILDLINQKGKMVNELQEATGASVNIVKGPAIQGTRSRGDGKVHISGSAEAVEQASAKVQELIAANLSEVVPLVNSDAAGAVVGKGGSTIKELQTATGASLDVDKKAGEVRVRGTADAVAAGVAAVKELLERYERENRSVQVDEDLLPTIIGSKGVGVKAISEESGAQIDIDSNSGTIRLRGPEEALDKAEAILRKIGRIGEPKDEITVLGEYMGYLVGRNGSNIARIQETHDVLLSLSRKKNLVVIRGPREGVAAAKEEVRAILKRAMQVEEFVDVPVAQLGRLIGRGGSFISQLQEETGANVSVPPASKRKGTGPVRVSIRGDVENVSSAKLVVSAIAKGRSFERVVYSPKHIEVLQGAGARNLAHAQRQYRVNVDINDASNALRVEGDEKNVHDAIRSVDGTLAFYFEHCFVIKEVPSTYISVLKGKSLAPAVKTEDLEEELEEGEVTEDEPVKLRTAAAIGEETGTEIHMRPDAGYVVVFAEEAAAVNRAIAEMDADLAVHRERFAEVTVEPWMVRIIVGAKGANIQRLEKETHCKIKIEREGVSKPIIEIIGASKAIVEKALDVVTKLVTALAKRHVEIPANTAALRLLAQRTTGHVGRIRQATNASIDLNFDGLSVVIRAADEAAVEKASAMVEETLRAADLWGKPEAVNTEEEIYVPHGAARVIIGEGGATIRELESTHGVRCRLDRGSNAVRVSGTEAAINNTRAALKELLEANGMSILAQPAGGGRRREEEKEEAPFKTTSFLNKESDNLSLREIQERQMQQFSSVPIGMDPKLVQKQRGGGGGASRNARRRARRRDQPGASAAGTNGSSAGTAADDNAWESAAGADLLAILDRELAAGLAPAPAAAQKRTSAPAPVAAKAAAKAPVTSQAPPGFGAPATTKTTTAPPPGFGGSAAAPAQAPTVVDPLALLGLSGGSFGGQAAGSSNRGFGRGRNAQASSGGSAPGVEAGKAAGGGGGGSYYQSASGVNIRM